MSRTNDLRSLYLREAEQWAFAASDWEVAAVAIVLTLATVRVLRLDADTLRHFGMLPKECHRNVERFVRMVGDRGARSILGWMKGPRVLTLHSVVEIDGKHLCVTPAAPDQPDDFEFIPDPAVEWRVVDGQSRAFRDGHAIGIGLRRYPRTDADWFGQVVQRLRSGMDPDEAIALGDPAFGGTPPYGALRRQ